MTNQPGDHISGNVTVGGGLSGELLIGKDISVERRGDTQIEITERDRAEAHALFEELRAQVRRETAGETQPAALQRVDELEEAVNSEKPRLSTVEHVRDWFADHLPKLAGAVTSVVLSPIVGKLVQAGGDMAAGELRRRLGRVGP